MRSRLLFTRNPILLALGVAALGGCNSSTGPAGGQAGSTAGGATGISPGGSGAGGSTVSNTGQVPAGTLGGCSLFPADNPWNTRVDALPLHQRSADYLKVHGGDFEAVETGPIVSYGHES